MKRLRLGIALALAAAGVSSLHGCKEKESLIVLTVRAADGSVTGLRTLVVTCGSTTQIFSLAAPVSTGTTSVGLYVPSGLTGSQSVVAFATGNQCGPGYRGNTTVEISAAGDTANGAILMNPATTCPPGGGTGTGGTSGPVADCVELDHGAPGSCAGCSTGSTGDMPVYSVAFSPTNPQLVVTGAANDATGVNGSVKAWTIGSSGTLTAQGSPLSGAGLNVVAFSPDGSALAVGRSGKVDIYQVSNWTLSSTVTISSGGSVYGVGFSPDATLLIVLSVTGSSASTSTATLAAYPASAPTTPFTATIPEGYALGVSPVTAGGLLPVAVTTVNGIMEVFNLSAAGFSTPVTVSVTSDNSYAEVATFGPSGGVLASGGDDGLLNFWSVPVAAAQAPDSSPIDIFSDTAASSQVWAAAFSPDGTQIAVGGGLGGSLTAWNAAAPRASAGSEFDPARGFDVVSVAYAPNGSVIVAGESNCGCVIACPQ